MPGQTQAVPAQRHAGKGILMTVPPILAELGRLALSTGIAYALSETLGKGWVEQGFARQLEEHKRRQQELLAEHTMRANSAFQRLSKLQEKEVEVLSDLWVKLCDARRKVQDAISACKDAPDVGAMPWDALCARHAPVFWSSTLPSS